jgi:uncharacterized protein YcbX
VSGVPAPEGAAAVVRLARYPVKGCAAELLRTAEVGPAGLRHDRVLAVVAGDRVATQRDLPQLARVRPSVDDERGALSLAAAGGATVTGRLDLGPAGRQRTVTLFGDPVRVVEQDDRLSGWLTDVLGIAVQLVAAPESSRRRTRGELAGTTALADEGSVSWHSEASLSRLNERLAARGHPAVPVERFRANVVVAGCAAHAEDRVSRLAVGTVLLGFAAHDERCVVTTVDQTAGERAGPEPLRTLADYRRGPGGGVRFGAYLSVLRPGRLALGDRVTLVSR